MELVFDSKLGRRNSDRLRDLDPWLNPCVLAAVWPRDGQKQAKTATNAEH
jgi:hypothetical protein